MKRMKRGLIWPGALLLLALLASCAATPREAELQATVDALSARNATLEAAPASAQAPMQALPQPTEAPAVEAAVDNSGAAAPAPPPHPTRTVAEGLAAAAPGRYPAAPLAPPAGEVVRVGIVADETHIADFRLDQEAAVAYLTDSDDTLHVVDLATRQEVATTPVSGDRLLLDAPNRRLYIMPDAPSARTDISPTVTIFDTASRTVVGSLAGSRVGIDSEGGRLYIGDVVAFYGAPAPGVRLYDAATLKLLHTGPMAGNPLYNPEARELIIQNASAWTADPATLEPRVDLYPEITGIDLPGCNGCPAVVDAFYFPIQRVVAIQTTILSPQGAGRVPPVDFYDAASMAQLPAAYKMDATCSSLPMARVPISEPIVRNEHYSRYVSFNNLYAENRQGDAFLVRDGMWVSFFNQETGVGYVRTSPTTGYVLWLDTLAPAEMIDAYCIFTLDTAGYLYATDAARHDLLIVKGNAIPHKTPTAQPDSVAGKQITQIVPSPNMAQDGTLYVVAWTLDAEGGQAILRSSDGGQTFARLGGLPSGQELALTLAVSPNFAQDKTLFAGGARRESVGEGVWKSTDGGASWGPVWNGLTYLRVNRLALSPRYAEDQTLLAWAPYADILADETGYSIQRSRDGGLSWTRVITADSLDLLPQATAYLPITAAAELPVRKSSWLAPIEVRVDNTSWTTATANLGAGEILRGIFASPPGAAAPTDYVATEKGVYRTLDAGATWSRLGAGEGAGALMAAAVTPLLGDGAYRLLLATAKGELIQLDPATVAWEAIEAPAAVAVQPPAAVPTATSGMTATQPVTPTATATATAVAPELAQEEPPAATGAVTSTGAGLVGEPPAGFFRPAGIFGPAWDADGALQQALGFARSVQPASVPAAYQYFEHGSMLWRGDTQQIYAIYDDGGWDVFADTFKEGEAESDPSLKAPSGLMQPVRGFGKVWRGDEAVRARLGWAVSKEAGINALVQDFEHGTYLRADAIEAALIQRPAGREWQR